MGKKQVMLAGKGYEELDKYLAVNSVHRLFLVCGASICRLTLHQYFETLKARMGIDVVRYSDFGPNPLYESVVEGVRAFRSTDSDLLAAVGGGSAMDVAKCIKLFSNMDAERNFLEQPIVPNDVRLLAIPTTAGTGSEATKYAVIYYQGEKQSLSDDSLVPDAVLLDAGALSTLPVYQRRSTMMDAFCHAVESFWSIHSTAESREYSRQAIQMICSNMHAYLANEEAGNRGMLLAANMAGKAINITQTTAGHAMCYKLTGLYGIAHGHAAALCLSELWPFMLRNLKLCVDPRGENYLEGIFSAIAVSMGCKNQWEAVTVYRNLLNELSLTSPKAKQADFDVLKYSVNAVRLKNNPIALSLEAVDYLYHQILE